MATAADIPLLIVSENSSSERRISPSWTIAQLKGRLEPVTGVPASCQRLSLKIGSQAAQPIEAADEESTILAAWPLQAYAEIKVGTILLLSSDVSNLSFRMESLYCCKKRAISRCSRLYCCHPELRNDSQTRSVRSQLEIAFEINCKTENAQET
jgi:hypothetical protein